MSYRMYLTNVENSILQADQAKDYAEKLEKQAVALRESEGRFRSAFDHSPIGIAIVSPRGPWLRVNRALTDILGYSESEFLAGVFQSAIFPEDLGKTMVRIHEVAAGKAQNCQMEQRYIHKSGHTVWASWSVSAAGEGCTGQPELIFQIQDITDKKLAEQRLHHDATHDALTGLANRTHFMNRLNSALNRSRRQTDHNVSVLFIDLDHFKNVNDSLGHQVGDRLLVAIADRLRSCIRPSDTVARFGGDEFAILVEGGPDRDEVVSIAERVQQEFRTPFVLGSYEISSSASIGILRASDTHASSDDMMRDADLAMYGAKRSGKARSEIFDNNKHRAMAA
jgi:diguanylate cyclase (GGDEF)-like protein/PAS domain S-box-containing protein